MSPALRRGLITLLAGLLLIGAALVVTYWRLGGLGEGVTDNFAGISIGGPFTLVDQNGVTRRDTDFRGKLMLVYFGYTFCPDACPTALQAISGALDKLGDRAQEVQPIFVTVDPARDTVEQMKLYASNFHPRLIALTGTGEQIAAAARAYRVYFEKVKQSGQGDYLVDHSSFVYVMGRDGRYLTHIASDAGPDAMAAALKPYL